MKTPTQVFSFTDSATVPGDRLDAQFADHALAITDTQDALADVRRSDGALKNGIVTSDSLAPGLKDELTTQIAAGVALDADEARNAAIDAEAARDLAVSAKNQTLALKDAVQVTHDQIMGGAGTALAEIAAAEDAAIVAKNQVFQYADEISNSANDATLQANYAQEYAEVAAAWAEYTPGPIPPNILAVMGITGEHWSARWWALYADNAAQQAEDAANGILNLGGFYLGAYTSPPTIDPFTQGPIKLGAAYYDLGLATLRLWNGTAWVTATIDYAEAATPIQTNIAVDVSWWAFDGATTSFPLKDFGGIPITPGAASGQIVSLDGIIQNPATEYTISGSTITFATAPVAGTAAWMVAGITLSGDGVTNGDKGDIVVSGVGSVWTIDNGAVNTAKMGGDVTAVGKALLNAATAAAQRTALGLGALATKAQAALATDVTGTLPIANGGTGATTAAAALAALGGAPLASPIFTGTPAAPTPTADTNTTQLATTAFVVGQASASNPAMNGTVSIGTSFKYARADHVHPTDTSRAPLASPAFTGTPTAPTPATADNSTTLATTAFVRNAITTYGGGAGSGDMLKSTYDTNSDGIVDRAALADSVAWANVSGKPSFGTMSTQNASAVAITGGSITNLTTFDGVTVDGGTF